MHRLSDGSTSTATATGIVTGAATATRQPTGGNIANVPTGGDMKDMLT